jgi:hypothetical protein
MIGELSDHTRQTWDHVLSGNSTVAEKMEVGAEAIIGVAALATVGRFAFSRCFSGTEAVASTEATLPSLKITSLAEELAPSASSKAPSIAEDSWRQLSFSRTPQIQQRFGETSTALHERLRPIVLNGFQSVREPTQIDTRSWYTFDASKTLGIDNSVAVMTSTCKHETPALTFVGIYKPDWMSELPSFAGQRKFRYKLFDLGRELTSLEKNAIYDKM